MRLNRKLVWLMVLFAAALASFSVSDASGFRRYFRLQREVAELEARNGGLRAEIDRLTKEIEDLRKDPKWIEQVAREELGFVKTGELVLKLE